MTHHAAGHFTPGLSAQPGTGFTPWNVAAARPAFVPWGGVLPIEEDAFVQPTGDDDDPLEAFRAEAYEAGFEAGRATIEADLVPERAAMARLAEGLNALRPEPSGPLALLLVEAVDRLVRQIVGEVDIDPNLLLSRAHAAAALIAEEARPSAVRLHPADHARLSGADLPVQMLADPGVPQGSVLLETAEGWIEDGVAARLDALRGALMKVAA
jgi:flagellar assembly protein FliH